MEGALHLLASEQPIELEVVRVVESAERAAGLFFFHVGLLRTIRFPAVKRILNFIDGQFRPPCSGRYLPDVNPATGQVIAEIAESGPEDVDAAVAAASRAFESWRRTPAEERSRLLIRVAELIEENFDELARLESEDSGKPIALARRMDVPRAILNFRFFATAILHAETPCHMTDDRALNYTLRQPLGVAGLISPWNLPLYLLTWKIAPAIAAGNCCVAKPSELTPLTADRLAALTLEAGIPPGVVNIVHGPGGERRPRPHVASERPAHLVHRRNEDGRGRDGPRGTALQESVPGARREEPEHRVRGRRSRAGRRHVDSVELRQPGGDLPLRIASVRREDRSTTSSSTAFWRERRSSGSEIRRTLRPTWARS